MKGRRWVPGSWGCSCVPFRVCAAPVAGGAARRPQPEPQLSSLLPGWVVAIECDPPLRKGASAPRNVAEEKFHLAVSVAEV